MSETLNKVFEGNFGIYRATSPAEIAVFGDAYSLKYGRNDEQSIIDLIESRKLEAESGKTIWVPSGADIEYGGFARYYKDRKVIAIVDVNVGTLDAQLYVRCETDYCDTPLFEYPVSFEKAVAAADQLANEATKLS